MNTKRKTLRLNKLVDRPLQLRMVLSFALTGVLAIGLQFVMTVNTMSEVALGAQAGPAEAYNAAADGATRVALTTLLVSLPIITVVGVLVTFRVTGPIYRMSSFLEAVARGERPGDLELRKQDELHDFARLLNEATRPLRVGEERAAEGEGRERDVA